ncbi:MMPL family transporter [Streptomyces xiamenensis]
MNGPSRATRWGIPLILLALWLGIGGVLGPFAGRLGEVSTNDQAAFLPQSAESTRVIEEQRAFDQDGTLPAIVVWTATDGGPLPEGAAAVAGAALAALEGEPGVLGVSPALPSEDGEALQGVVQLPPDLGEELEPVLESVREAVTVPGGLTALIGGPAASQVDLSGAFAGIDGLLLGVAVITVLLILLLVYRSVLLPLAIITGAVLALALACAVVYALADRDIVRVDGQVQGILSILVIGAATDYALLYTARFREELVAGRDGFPAALRAARNSAGAIVASAATVALGLLALLLSDLTNNQALGPVGAIGIACAVLSTLTFLPAVLILLGRSAYWPARLPRTAAPAPAGHEPDTTTEVPEPAGGAGVWHRVAALVDRAPRKVWATTLALLVACAAFAPLLDSRGVPLEETFIRDAPSVTAQAVLSEHFPGGSGNPAVVIAAADAVTEVAEVAAATAGVDSATPVTASGAPGGEPLVVDGRVRIDVTLADPADSRAAEQTVERLRDALGEVPGADALVGGYTAQQYDTQATAASDRLLIVPVVLVIIVLVLVGLLRSLLMPVLLVATVALNYLATLGISALVFQYLFGFSGTDASVPLYGFVFLVALGVDYNIFLMSRVRQETVLHGTRQGLLRGLISTGGVITSAGVVLAATFAALLVIPLAFLAQLAFIVAFGVLVDTLVVRSLLVPALVRDIGPRSWWPARPGGAADEPAGDREKTPAGV